MTQISIPKELADHARKIAAEHFREQSQAGPLGQPEIIEMMASMFVQGWIDWTLAQSVLRKGP